MRQVWVVGRPSSRARRAMCVVLLALVAAGCDPASPSELPAGSSLSRTGDPRDQEGPGQIGTFGVDVTVESAPPVPVPQDGVGGGSHERVTVAGIPAAEVGACTQADLELTSPYADVEWVPFPMQVQRVERWLDLPPGTDLVVFPFRHPAWPVAPKRFTGVTVIDADTGDVLHWLPEDEVHERAQRLLAAGATLRLGYVARPVGPIVLLDASVMAAYDDTGSVVHFNSCGVGRTGQLRDYAREREVSMLAALDRLATPEGVRDFAAWCDRC